MGLYSVVITVFLGTKFMAINIGIGSISLYRLSVLLMVFVSFIYMIWNYRITSYKLDWCIYQFDVVYIFWLCWGFLSVIWAQSTSRWIHGMFFITFGILSILFISNSIKTKDIMKSILYILFTLFILHQLVGFFEIFTRHYFFNDMGQISGSSLGKPLTIFRNVNDYSTLIFFSVSISMIIFNISKRKIVKVIAILSILMTIVLLTYTSSRGNQLALIIFFLSFLTLEIKVSVMHFKKPLMIAIITLIIFVVLYFIFLELRLNIYGSLLTFFRHEGSNTYRVNMLLNGIVFLIKTFGFGVGAGNIEHWMVESPVFRVDAPNMHNWFFDILVGYGWIVFLFYIVMYIVIIKILYQSFIESKDTFYKNTSLFLLCYVIAFIISSISSASNIIIEWQWVSWGIIIGYVKLLLNNSQVK